MIREKSVFGKLKFLENSSAGELSDSCLKALLNIGLNNLTGRSCAYCGATSDYQSWGTYTRCVYDYTDGEKAVKELTIPRVMCDCGHTHGLLTDILIPYTRYSLLYVLQVLNAYFTGHHTKVYICVTYGVSYYLLTKWLGLWDTNKLEWLGILQAEIVSDQQYMNRIIEQPNWSEFAAQFTRKTGASLFQVHVNPEEYVRKTKTAAPGSCSA